MRPFWASRLGTVDVIPHNGQRTFSFRHEKKDKQSTYKDNDSTKLNRELIQILKSLAPN